MIMKEKEKNKKEVKVSGNADKQQEQKPKSSIALFWEKHPHGYMGGMTIKNMRAVLK